MKLFTQDTAAIFDAKSRAVRAYNLMQWARWATFGLYIVAVFMLYVSDVWGIATYLENNSNEYIALVVFSITSFILAYFLASSKEAVYEDIALNRSEGFRLTGGQKFAMGLFASAGILFELFSATSNQQHISNNAAEQAGLLKPAEVGSVSINTPPALTTALMSARARLNNCQEQMKQGRMKDCNHSEGKLAGALQAIELNNQTAAAVTSELVDKTNARNEKLLERFDKPMFKVVGKAVGGDTNDGMIVAVAVMITIFELQHILSVFAYGNALRRMNTDKLGKPPATATEPEPQAAPASYLQKAGEAVAGEMMKAQAAREQLHGQMQEQAEKIGNTLDKNYLDWVTPEDSKPEQDAKTIRQRLREGEKAFPGNNGLDTPTPHIQRMSVKDTIARIVADVKQSGSTTPADIHREVVKSYSGMVNPADFDAHDLKQLASGKWFKTASNRPTPDAASPSFGSAETVPFGSREAVDVKQHEAVKATLYQAWREAVAGKEITPAERPFVELARKFSDLDGVSNRELKPVWDSFLDRGVSDGFLKVNPEFSEGNRKARVIVA